MGLQGPAGESGVPPIDPYDPGAQDAAIATLTPGAVTMQIHGMDGTPAIAALSRIGVDIPIIESPLSREQQVVYGAAVIAPITVRLVALTPAQTDFLKDAYARFIDRADVSAYSVTLRAFDESGASTATIPMLGCRVAAYRADALQQTTTVKLACADLSSHLSYAPGSIQDGQGDFAVRLDSEATRSVAVSGGEQDTELRLDTKFGGYLPGNTVFTPLSLGTLPANRNLRDRVIEFFGTRPTPRRADARVEFIDPVSGATTVLGTYPDAFYTRLTLFNPLGAVRATGRLASTIDVTMKVIAKQ